MSWRLTSALITIAISGCSSVPPFDLTVNGPPSAPAGPKVAALLANLKCELYLAANSTEVITRYYDDPGLAAHYESSGERPRTENPDRWFTLKNLFEEIEYVGEAQFQLDVTSTPSASPSTNFFPSSTLTLSVNGSVNEIAHRNIGIYSSIDFERLIKSLPRKGVKDTEGPIATFWQRGAEEPSTPCGTRTELGGFLGLQEDLTYHAITGDMNDLSVFPGAGSTTKIQVSDFFSKWGVDALTITVDFTINSGVNGGPNWVITHFTGPTVAGPLLSYSRAVKDTLTLTIIPICIRQKYLALNKAPPYNYQPRLIQGTPRWGNFLPPCATSQHLKAQAVSTARTYNSSGLTIRIRRQRFSCRLRRSVGRLRCRRLNVGAIAPGPSSHVADAMFGADRRIVWIFNSTLILRATTWLRPRDTAFSTYTTSIQHPSSH